MISLTRMSVSLYLVLSTLALAQDAVKKEDSELGFAIMGAIVQKDTTDNVALIKEDSGTVLAVKKDFIIMDKYKVVAVNEHNLELIDRQSKHYTVYHGKFFDEHKQTVASGGKSEALSDKYQEEGFERNGGKINVSASFRDKLVNADLAKVLMQATAEPNMENGVINGFKMSQIDEGSIFAKAGLNNGDIVTSINGSELNNIANSIALLKSLKGTDHIDVDIKRNGSVQKVSIDIR